MNQFLKTASGSDVEFSSLSDIEKIKVLAAALESSLSTDMGMVSYRDDMNDCEKILELAEEYLANVL